MAKVLLTGGSGFIAAHVLDILLEHGFQVVTTVRSQEKGQRILEAHPGVPKEKLSFVIVEDVAKEGAFDEAVKSDPPFDYVIHTASPFHHKFTDPVTEILDPAIKGTTGILKAIKTSAPTVKRVVITSSFAALVNNKQHPKLYDESVWNPVTWEEASTERASTYRGSKTLAEKSAWEFVEKEKPNFDVATINPPLVYGPVVHYLNSLSSLNTSNERINDFIQGKAKDGLPPSGMYLWVDVRDVALAHVKAIEVAEAGGKRFFTVAGFFSNKAIVDAIRETHPEYAAKLPENGVDDIPADIYQIDNSRVRSVLGIQFRSLKESVGDTHLGRRTTVLEHHNFSAMATHRLSPTANLLRNSRLFALPPVLNPPPKAITSKTVVESNSSTLSHPIRAAIETPPSALARGEWGLKRPLPAKSTTERSSKPVIRVNALDTFEHVTDFDSAGDHTMTLLKFQELNLPISLPSASKAKIRDNGIGHESPFESRYDNVSESKGVQGSGAKLYRHSGPWLGGQTEIQFQNFLQQIQRQKPELLKKLRENYVERLRIERRTKAQNNGELDSAQFNESVEVTDEEFQLWLKKFRTNKKLAGAELTRLLDLHSLTPAPLMGESDYYEANAKRLASSQYVSSGPPRTHPSAGLAYTRSGAILHNHPSFGPQIAMRPVEARCLVPKTKKRKSKRRAVMGVAGITYEDAADELDDSIRGLEYLDPSIPGGGRVFVSPRYASVYPQGTIDLEASRAGKDVLAPYGLANYEPPRTTNIAQVARTAQREVPRLDRSGPRTGTMDGIAELFKERL
ncbi:mitochondrial ribosomal protein subunit-domain-containing protein [Talaromyces proteolyticus]|uniref:Mitochondrial ribosomal protein subunit-domain-containing protein n=1 Tax=Talaromyces proteolyticus TaxID=1131652 RepID=A0AAD4KIK1_9EURO|nr:mitochondrial ribosomal protein subunit-domain-containing protein [Talaromyces proteolyticus]KAH8691188.1 mitochondrial ribosomal protein subunit-domain-containing protein [Talaromyces proteolyticus]